MYSKVWSNRDEGLLELYRHLEELPGTTDKDVAKNKFRAASFLIERTLRDKVFAVSIYQLNVASCSVSCKLKYCYDAENNIGRRLGKLCYYCLKVCTHVIHCDR